MDIEIDSFLDSIDLSLIVESTVRGVKRRWQSQHRCSSQRRVEADRQTYSLFRESSSVALQALTDLEGLEMVAMVRRLAAQEHSAALAQRASRISAIMKFSVGADDDPFVKVKVQSASASQKQTSCLNLTMRVDRIVAAVLISIPMAARLFITAS